MSVARTNIGKVSPVVKGEFSSGAVYERLDIVLSGGVSYIAKQAVPAGQTPPNGTYWMPLLADDDAVAAAAAAAINANEAAASAQAVSLEGKLAPAYDVTEEYAAGDYVIYAGDLYRFVLAHEPGNWVGSDALKVTAAEEVQKLNDIRHDAMIVYPFLFDNTIPYYINKNTGRKDHNVSVTPYTASTWIPLVSSKIYVNACAAGDDAGYAFYNEHKEYITGGNVYNSNVAPHEIILDVPENAKFFRFTNYKTLTAGTYVKGYPDRIDENLYDHIPWYDGHIYNGSTGEIVVQSGASCSDMLMLHSSLDQLAGYKQSNNYFYLNLYDEDNVCVGSLRKNGYYNTSGVLVENPIPFYSFAITVQTPYTNFLSQEVYFQEPIALHYRIDVNTVAKLESALLKAAEFSNPFRIYDIYIAAGTYDLWNEIDFSRISGTGDTAYHRGLEIPSYTNLYGIGNCVLDLTVPSTGRDYSTVIACLNTHCVEASIHNITLTTYDGRYCVHDDSYPNYTKDHTILWDHCTFEHRGRPDATMTTAAHCYGAGFYSGAKAIFRNCVFKAGNSMTGLNWAGVAIHGHTGTGDGNVDKPFFGEVENCSFLGVGHAILPYAMVDGIAHQYDFHVTDSYFAEGNIIWLRGKGGNRLFGGGNSPVTIQQDYSNSVYLVETKTEIIIDDSSTTIQILDDRYHTKNEVNSMLAAKASVASPAFSGNPTTPNQAAGSNNTRIANTAYADAAASSAATGAVEPVKNVIAIVENTNVCTHEGGIEKGQYVIWNGNLYTASSAISVGATLTTSNLSRVLKDGNDIGGLNDLNGKLNQFLGATSITDGNSATDPGVYSWGNSSTNLPFTYGMMLVLENPAGRWITQFAVGITSNKVSYRKKNNQNWSEWTTII